MNDSIIRGLPDRIRPRVALIGAGLAGAVCARQLHDAGLQVEVFDKSRGVGGRMATRRARVSGPEGAPPVLFDHGVPWWTSRSEAFTDFLSAAEAAGNVQRWRPHLQGAGSPQHTPAKDAWVASPDMPALCRWLLRDLPVRIECTVTALQHSAEGWQIVVDRPSVDGTSVGVRQGGLKPTVEGAFDAVVVAIPPKQAATLWAPHHPDWAEQDDSAAMVPTWTLMALGQPTPPAMALPSWDVCCPADGPLALVVRQDAKPGRRPTALAANPSEPAASTWVAHARPEWSQAHLEEPADAVLSILQQALESVVNTPMHWPHAVVHRWRYAQAAQPMSAEASDHTAAAGAVGGCRWDARMGLGACGDWLGGGGVEGAWASGRALAQALLSSHGV